MSWGSSSIRDLRSTPPMAVMRLSPGTAQRAPPESLGIDAHAAEFEDAEELAIAPHAGLAVETPARGSPIRAI